MQTLLSLLYYKTTKNNIPFKVKEKENNYITYIKKKEKKN